MDRSLIRSKPFLALVIVFAMLGILMWTQTKDLQSIPTCLYGCDYYYENGVALDMQNNPGHTWQSSAHDWLGVTNTMPKSYFYLRAFFSTVFGYEYFNSWKSVFLMTYALMALGLFGWFMLFSSMFKNRYLAVAMSTLTMLSSFTPFFKYSRIFIPLLPFYLMMLERLYKDKKDLLISALIIAATVFIANIHAMTFFLAYSFIFFGLWVMVYETWNPIKMFKKLKEPHVLRKTILVGIIGVASFAINLLLGWWYRILFVFGGMGNAPRFDVHVDLNIAGNFLEVTMNLIKSYFFTFNSASQSIITILTLAGILLFIIIKMISKEKEDHIIWITAAILAPAFCHLITVPILHKHLSPSHIVSFTSLLFKATFIGYLFNTIPKIKNIRIERKNMEIVITALSIILIVALTYLAITTANKTYTEDKFWQGGKNPLSPQYASLQSWIRQERMNPSDMIMISSNEVSFALHGTTGAKLFLGRQSHFFNLAPFQDFYMDGAILLYGNDTEKKTEILQELQQKAGGKRLYIYWDYYWINSEWQAQGEQYHPFDPLRFEYSQDRQQELDNNGIKYMVMKDAIFEPSAQNSALATRMTIMYVSPENYHNATHPWKTDIDQYLHEVWSYEQDGTTMARLYEIKVK